MLSNPPPLRVFLSFCCDTDCTHSYQGDKMISSLRYLTLPLFQRTGLSRREEKKKKKHNVIRPLASAIARGLGNMLDITVLFPWKMDWKKKNFTGGKKAHHWPLQSSRINPQFEKARKREGVRGREKGREIEWEEEIKRERQREREMDGCRRAV